MYFKNLTKTELVYSHIIPIGYHTSDGKSNFIDISIKLNILS